MTRESVLPLSVVVGRSVRRLRAERDMTTEDLASRLSGRFGMAWTRATVGALERGERDLTMAEFVVLLVALPAKPKDLLPDDQTIRLGSPKNEDGRVVWSQDLVALLEGVRRLDEAEGWAPRKPSIRERRRHAIEVAAQLEPEQKAARKLGVSAVELSEAAFALWEHGLTAERERRLNDRKSSERPTRAVRGHITRALIAELESQLESGTAKTDSASVARRLKQPEGNHHGKR